MHWYKTPMFGVEWGRVVLGEVWGEKVRQDLNGLELGVGVTGISGSFF